MIISKTFDCTMENVDEIVVALAKEIEDGYHITKMEHHGCALCLGINRTEPEFSITLTRKIFE